MKKIAFSLFILITFSSCVYFLFPVTDNDADLVFEKQIIGQWQQHDLEKYIVDTVAGTGGLKYQVLYITHYSQTAGDSTYIISKDTTYIVGKIVKIDNDLYLDCILDEKIKDHLTNTSNYMLLPVHIFYKIRFVDNQTIILSSFVADKIQQLTDQKKLSFRTEILPDSSDLLILNRSSELQAALRQLQKFPEAFENDTLRRVINYKD